MGMVGQRHVQTALPPGKCLGTHLYRRLSGPQTRLDRYVEGKSFVANGVRSPDRPSRNEMSYTKGHIKLRLCNKQYGGRAFVCLYWYSKRGKKERTSTLQRDTSTFQTSCLHFIFLFGLALITGKSVLLRVKMILCFHKSCILMTLNYE